VTFGQRYNLTGGEYYSDTGYVETFAAVLGVDVDTVAIPHDLMDALWDGNADFDLGGGFSARMDIRSSGSAPSARQLETARKFALTRLIQRLAPNLHRWNHSVIFSIDKLRHDIGWEPQHSFAGAVEQTYEWFCREGLDQTVRPDFGFEDRLLDLISSR
jgi:nucleoside-diphosphate-sugar epimerase